LYEVGLTGIPILNTNNNCCSGATAMNISYNMIRGGIHDCCLALGFEKMQKGSLASANKDREFPIGPHMRRMPDLEGISNKYPWAPQIFGNAGIEHMKKYGTKPEHFAKVAYKNHKHSVKNPYSQFKDYYTLEQIMKSPQVHPVLTK